MIFASDEEHASSRQEACHPPSLAGSQKTPHPPIAEPMGYFSPLSEQSGEKEEVTIACPAGGRRWPCGMLPALGKHVPWREEHASSKQEACQPPSLAGSQKTPHPPIAEPMGDFSPLSEHSGEKEEVTIAGPPGEDQDEGQDLARPVWHASRSGEA